MSSYLQIFNYLKEFAKLRNKSIYDIESSAQYQNIWLESIVNSDIFYNALSGGDKKDYWLKLKKPKAPQEPPIINPPKKLIDWIDEKSLYDENTEPFLKEEITLNGQDLYLIDHPELQNTLVDYIDDKWLDELLGYKQKTNKYKLESEQYKES